MMENHSIIVGACGLLGFCMAMSGSSVSATGPVVQSSGGAPLFVESAAATGLRFVHVTGASGNYDLPEIMGAGLALFDFDDDGDLDVFLVQGGPTGAGAGRAPDTSRLFRNDLAIAADGRRTLRFTDVTPRAGVGFTGQGMGAATGDYDNDGDLDLFVTAFGGNALYRNDGNGTFANVTAAAGVRGGDWSTGAVFVDYDRDGRLDLFVTHYVNFTVAGRVRCTDATGARDYCSPKSYRPVQDRLYRNIGSGRFSDVTVAAGIAKTTGNGMGVVAGDYNGDGWLDLYVANDATPNQLWINRRDGSFVDQGFLSGTAVNAAGNPEGSMGIASGDVDRDGDEDLFVTNLVGETHVLYTNTGPGLFEDVRTRAGLGASTVASTGFGTAWFDYDNDGWLDLFFTSGGVTIVPAQRGQPRPYRMRNQLFRNGGNARFVETSGLAGLAFTEPEVGRGAAAGDLDNDGDLDVVLTTNGGPARVFLNQSSTAHHWLRVRLDQGRPFSSSRPAGFEPRAFGAWVGVERAGQATLWRRVGTDGSYLSATDSRVHYGLGPSAEVAAVVVQWPDGTRERFTGVSADRTVTLRRGTGSGAAATAGGRGGREASTPARPPGRGDR
jgi:hypothetical protein